MAQKRVLMIGLDGFELSIADALMAEGRLPRLQRIKQGGAMVRLHHAEKRTGVAWEHVSTGLRPEVTERWSVVDYDSDRYRVIQRGATFIPFTEQLDVQTVVFDAPYFQLSQAPNACGLVAWGAHDASVLPFGRPLGLANEIAARFGSYPASQWIYGASWPSPERTAEMAEALRRGVEVRMEVAEWLLAERLPDWNLGYVVISEYHSAVEAFWHGVDPDHPLHDLASAEPARLGLEAIYEAGDRMIGRLADRFPDAELVLFNPHGMGPIEADVPGMLLLPELLYRHSFGKSHLRPRTWPTTAAGVPLLTGTQTWEAEMARLLDPRLFLLLRAALRRAQALPRAIRRSATSDTALDWMPATLYRKYWSRMPAFALPAFLDGRIRINLKGRERRGIVEPESYAAVCEELATLLRDCRDVLTGDEVVASIDTVGFAGRERGRFAADMIISWKGSPLGLVHPRLGQIGPVPHRRTGGHTGKHGVAYFAGSDIEPGDHGIRDAFDVVPTVVELLGKKIPPTVAGVSLLSRILAKSSPAGEVSNPEVPVLVNADLRE
jgi:predicted AlkP superfamily phosphohydrolase/phosphomutase